VDELAPENANQASIKEVLDSVVSVSTLMSQFQVFEISDLGESQSSFGKEVLASISDVVSRIPSLPHLDRQSNSKFSVLRAAGRHMDENLHSDFLASVLNSDITGDFAFSLFDEIVMRVYPEAVVGVNPPYQFVKRELQLQSIDNETNERGLRRLDILVHRPSEVMVFENKIWSAESTDQTLDYASTISRAFPGRKKYCILLSPFGSSGASREFRGFSYKDLYFCMEKILQSTASKLTRPVEFYFAELSDIIRDFYR
jgi:hypothetical protein